MEPGLSALISDTVFNLHAPAFLNLSPREKIQKAASAFTAIFINETLQLAYKADMSIGGGLMESDETRMVRGLYLHQLAIGLATGDQTGVKEMIARQLEYQERVNGKT